MRETHPIKGTTKPQWDSEFEIPVLNIQVDELNVSVWDDSINNDTDSIKTVRKRKISKNILRHFRGLSEEKQEGMLGQLKISLKDIPVLGTSRWYDLYEDNKNKKRAHGKLKIRIQLTARHSTENAESDQCSSEDYFSVIQRVYRHAMEQCVLDTEQAPGEERPVFIKLSMRSRTVLDQFAAHNHFTKISQNIIELSALLEAYCDKDCPCIVSDDIISALIDSTDALWMNRQKQNRCREIHGALPQRDHFIKTEVSLVEQMAMSYMDQIAARLYNDSTFPKTFPPAQISITELKLALGFSKQLLSLCHKLSDVNTKNRLTELLKDRIQADCQNWWSIKLQCIKSKDRDAVISESKIFTGVIREAIECCSPCMEISQYFIEFNINYEKTAIIYIEQKISAKTQEMLLRIDAYQKKFSRYRPNIQESSMVSQTIFALISKFVKITKSHFTMRDLYRITLISYQDWFKQAVTYWLQTFREEGLRRVGKAIDIEKDVVGVTEGVKISNSAVDVVTNLHKICSEWKEVDYTDADISLLAATKITELICEGITRYVEKLESILENNGYYDFIDNSVFDVTDQLCITLNNIVHVIRYIQRLPELLEWEKVCQNMSMKYEDPSVGQRCLTTLERLTRTTMEDLALRSKALWRKVAVLMERDLEMYILKFTRCHPNTLSSVDALLDYLKTNLVVLHEKLDNFIFPSVVEDLWNKSIAILSKTLLKGQHPDYYRLIHSHLECLYAYFEDVGLMSSVRDCRNYTQLVGVLTLHYTSTEELILQYYHDLNSQINGQRSPGIYYGHLEVKIGYKLDPTATVDHSNIKVKITCPSADETDALCDNNIAADQAVNLFVNVSRAKNLPGMLGKGEASNPFVSLALGPSAFFPINRDLKTPVVKGTINPMFDVTYQYQGIPLSLLRHESATLQLTAWHSDLYLPCHHFLGEATIPLTDVEELNPLQCIDDLTTVTYPLTRPDEPTCGPFKVLVERQSWDKLAKDMVVGRRRDTGMTTAWPLCRPMTYILTKVWGGQSTKVVGQPKLFAPTL